MEGVDVQVLMHLLVCGARAQVGLDLALLGLHEARAVQVFAVVRDAGGCFRPAWSGLRTQVVRDLGPDELLDLPALICLQALLRRVCRAQAVPALPRKQVRSSQQRSLLDGHRLTVSGHDLLLGVKLGGLVRASVLIQILLELDELTSVSGYLLDRYLLRLRAAVDDERTGQELPHLTQLLRLLDLVSPRP